MAKNADKISGWFLPDSHDPFLTAREGALLIPCSEAKLRRRVADGTLPPPVRIGGMRRWLRSEILEVIEAAKMARSVVSIGGTRGRS